MNIAAASAVRPPRTSLVHRRAHRGRRSQAVRDRRLAQRRFLEDVDSTGEDFCHDDFSRCPPKSSQPAENSGFCAGADRSRVVFPSYDVFPTEVSAAAPKGDGPDLSGNLPSGASGQSRVQAPHTDIETHFSVLHLNVDGFTAHMHIFDALLALHDFPEFVAITETHLTKEVKWIGLTKYELVSRRDRPDQRGWGGIALFARHDVYQSIVFVKESATLELAWYTLHADVGPLLLGVWYRPPKKGEIQTIQQFDRELEGFEDHIGRLIIGDMNVHNEAWLTYSNGTSPEGRELEAVCAEHGLTQCVKVPTRGEHLLDLVLTDLPAHSQCSVHPGVLDKDHWAVIVDVAISIPSCSAVHRTCFDFGKAKWSDIKTALKSTEWETFFAHRGADAAALELTEKILSIVKEYVPVKDVVSKPYKHPWIDDRCRELLRQKHASIGTPGFAAARDACTAGFTVAFSEFLADTRKKLKEATCKDWWKISKDLMSSSKTAENIPPLKRGKEWAKQPGEKATLLAETFAAKAKLPDAVTNEFSEVHRSDVSLRLSASSGPRCGKDPEQTR